MRILHYSVALVTFLRAVVIECSSWLLPLLSQVCDDLHALLFISLCHDFVVSSEVMVPDDRGHGKLTCCFVWQHRCTHYLEWFLFHCQDRQHIVIGSKPTSIATMVVVRSHCGEAGHAPTPSRSDDTMLGMVSGSPRLSFTLHRWVWKTLSSWCCSFAHSLRWRSRIVSRVLVFQRAQLDQRSCRILHWICGHGFLSRSYRSCCQTHFQ